MMTATAEGRQLDMLRPSLRMRAAPFMALADAGFSGDIRAAMAERRHMARSAADFLEALRTDYVSSAENAIGLLRGTFDELSGITPRVVFDANDYTCNARVSGADRPRITIPIGLILALEEVILATATTHDFLSDTFSDDEAGTIEVPYYRWQSRSPELLTCQEALAASLLDVMQIGSAIPLATWRLMQCEFMIDTAFQFIVMHEIAHWSLGHTLYAQQLGLLQAPAWEELGLQNSTQRLAGKEGIARCIELQADSVGFDFLVSPNVAVKEPRSLLCRFNEAFSKVYVPRHTLASLNPNKATRLLTVSSAAVIMLLEMARAQASTSAGNTHPTPEARAYNLLRDQFGLSLYDYGQINEEGVLVFRNIPNIDINAVFKSIMRETLALSLYDMKFLARTMGVPHLFVETADQKMVSRPLNFRDSPVLQDLVLELLPRPATAFTTQAAKENAAMKLINNDVRAACKPYWRFG